MKTTEVSKRLREIAREGVRKRWPIEKVQTEIAAVMDEFSDSPKIKRTLQDEGVRQARYLLQSTAPQSDRRIAERLIEQSGSQLVRVGGLVKTAVQGDVQRELLRGSSVSQIEAVIERRTRLLRSQVSAIASTAKRALNRATVIQNAIRAGVNEFVYTGKVGPNTRPFCIKLLKQAESGKVWTVAEIRKLDNGQGLDPLYYGGGYYCVHPWSPYIKE